MAKRQKLTTNQLYQVAAMSAVDHRTVQRYTERGLVVQRRNREEIDAALRELGLEHAIRNPRTLKSIPRRRGE